MNVELSEKELAVIMACIRMAAREGLYLLEEDDDEEVLVQVMKKLGEKESTARELIRYGW